MTTLQKIRRKVRRLTATPSSLQLPDSEIDEYINTFYTQDMPADIKLYNLHDKYEFYTVANEDEYTLPVNQWLGVNPPIYVNGYQCNFTEKRDNFFKQWPEVLYTENVAAGDGSAGPYTFTLTNTPVLRRTFYVSVQDSGNFTRTLVDIPNNEETGNLVADGTTTTIGTINYITGAVTVTTFGANIDSGETIKASYFPYVASRPSSVLFYDDTFKLRPVPDKAYKVVVEAYVKPTELLASSSSPELEQWWQFLAYGAAIKVLEDRQDTETLQNLLPIYDDQKQKVLHRTILQQTPERTSSIYTDQTQVGLSNQYWGGF